MANTTVPDRTGRTAERYRSGGATEREGAGASPARERPTTDDDINARGASKAAAAKATMDTPPFDTQSVANNVIVVDPHPIGREGLRACLDANDCTVIAAAADGAAAVLAANDHPGAIVIVSASLTRPNAATTVRRLRQTAPDSEIVVIGVGDDPLFVRDLVNQGVGAIVSADAPPDEYWTAVHAVRFGAVYMSGSIAQQMFSTGMRNSPTKNPYGLTVREIDILRSLSEGMSNKEVARRLDLSVRTVETHRLNIRRKTNSHNLSDLVRISRMLEADNSVG